MNAADERVLSPTTASRKTGRIPLKFWLGAGLVAACALLMRLSPGPEIVDDAYITYRIAGNIAEGNGFVYNPGERLQSSTAPLYALLLSTAGSAGVEIAWGSYVLNALSGMAAAVFLFWIIGHLCGDWKPALAASLLFGVFPGSVMYSISGMETAFFEFSLIAAGAAFLFRKDWVATVLAGFLPLVRPEGLVVSGIIGLGLLIVKRNRVWRYGLVAALPLVIWVLWATWYFGTPVPHSVTEKQQFFADHPGFAVGVLGFLRQWIYHFYSLFWGNPVHFERIRNTQYWMMLAGSVPFALGYGYQIIRLGMARPRALPLALTPGLLAGAAILGQAGLPFPWYFMPTAGLFIALSMGGLYLLLRDVLLRIRSAWAPAAGMAVLVAGVLLAGSHAVLRYEWSPRILPRCAPVHRPPYREPTYEEAARWIAAQNGDSATLVICSEVGAIGYFCPFKIWDQHLTTPPWITERNAELVDRYRPRFITYMGLYPPLDELTDQPDRVRVGVEQVAYRKVYSVNKDRHPDSPRSAELHNVLVYELEQE